MNRLRAIVCAILSLAGVAQATAGDDFGLWGEASLTRRLPHRLSVGLDLEGRLKDHVRTFDRWGVGLNVGYKPLSWLKLNVGYIFMQSYTEHKRKEHYKDDISQPDHWNGYNITSDFITPKHRLVVAATFTSPKIGKWVRVSLRERYQFTAAPEQVVDRWKHRFDYSPQSGFASKADSPEYDPTIREAKRTHALRSRLKVEMDKKRIDWHPFVMGEVYNDPTDGMRVDGWRVGAGTSWDFMRDHTLSLTYLYDTECDPAGDAHRHIVSVGYEFKF